jgi:hypothetical protein
VLYVLSWLTLNRLRNLLFVPGVGLIYLKRQYNMGAGFPAKIKLQAETLPSFYYICCKGNGVFLLNRPKKLMAPALSNPWNDIPR